MKSMVKIYINGCRCGKIGELINKVLLIYPYSEIINTRWNRKELQKHVKYLNDNKINSDSYIAIVVNENNVVRLDQWKP